MVIERSFAWLCRNRRLARDFKRLIEVSAAMAIVAVIQLLIAARQTLDLHAKLRGQTLKPSYIASVRHVDTPTSTDIDSQCGIGQGKLSKASAASRRKRLLRPS
jgi:hypothetical protein